MFKDFFRPVSELEVPFHILPSFDNVSSPPRPQEKKSCKKAVRLQETVHFYTSVLFKPPRMKSDT